MLNMTIADFHTMTKALLKVLSYNTTFVKKIYFSELRRMQGSKFTKIKLL